MATLLFGYSPLTLIPGPLYATTFAAPPPLKSIKNEDYQSLIQSYNLFLENNLEPIKREIEKPVSLSHQDLFNSLAPQIYLAENKLLELKNKTQDFLKKSLFYMHDDLSTIKDNFSNIMFYYFVSLQSFLSLKSQVALSSPHPYLFFMTTQQSQKQSLNGLLSLFSLQISTFHFTALPDVINLIKDLKENLSFLKTRLIQKSGNFFISFYPEEDFILFAFENALAEKDSEDQVLNSLTYMVTNVLYD
ncbi:MAG: hypothetical protein D6797_08305, partial [Bdellovibrio sp.]